MDANGDDGSKGEFEVDGQKIGIREGCKSVCRNFEIVHEIATKSCLARFSFGLDKKLFAKKIFQK